MIHHRQANGFPCPVLAPVRVVIEGVSLHLEDRRVFEDLTLSVNVRRLGLIGRNGSGKSQLLRLIAGLTRPDVGTVRVNGYDPATDRRRATAEIGFLFQNPDHALLFPTVLEELSFGPRSQGKQRAQAEAAARAQLGRFGCGSWSDRLVHSLSQGQKHLLGLMAATMCEPRLLLLDEAFAGLDLTTSLALRQRLEARTEARIEASHDLIGLASCDHVLWIEDGRVRERGEAAAVIARYRTQMEAQAGAGPI